MRRHRTGIVSLLTATLSLVVALVGALALAGPAVAAPTGAISGVVFGPDGQPLSGAEVSAYRYGDDENWHLEATVTANDIGNYLLSPVPVGDYIVGFSAAGMMSEYWDDAIFADDARTFTITAGTTKVAVDAELSYAGDITGTLTVMAGLPIEGVSVRAYRSDNINGWPTQVTSTGTNGAYDLRVPVGSYRIEFAMPYGADYVGEFWPNVATIGEAENIGVSAGQVRSGIDAVISRLGHITGTVTGPDGRRTAGVEVRPLQYDESADFWYPVLGRGATTDAFGGYDIGGMEPGRYRLRFEDQSGRGYLTEFWNDASTVEDGTDVVVGLDRTVSDRNARLALGGQITGRVTDVGGSGIEQIEVLAYRWSGAGAGWEEYTYGYTDSAGAYTVAGLPTGRYRLRFDDTVGGDHLTEYWDDAGDVGTGVDIVAKAGAITSGKNAQLTEPSDPIIANTSAPAISGAPRVGSRLTAGSGTWSPSTDVTVSYRWFVNGSQVLGATSPTYVPIAADMGKTVQVQVRATASGYTSRTAASAARTVASGVLRAERKPTVSGTARKNAVLTVFRGIWRPKATARIQWYAGGKPIARATGPKLRLTGTIVKAVAGRTISARVTVNAPGYTPVTVTLKVKGKVRA